MQIIYEDNHLIAINKSPSELVQQDKTDDESLIESLKRYIIARDKKPGDTFIVPIHRLDRPVSGVVLFAKTSKALSRMSELFRDHKVKKSYLAICQTIPNPENGEIISFLKKNEKKNQSYIVAAGTKGAKEAKLSYKLVGASERYCMLSVDLHSGRHHQIRVQLSSIGCAIRGDLKYGYPRSNKDGSISLHSRSLEFIHPIKKEPIKIVAPLPTRDNVWQFFASALELFEKGEN